MFSCKSNTTLITCNTDLGTTFRSFMLEWWSSHWMLWSSISPLKVRLYGSESCGLQTREIVSITVRFAIRAYYRLHAMMVYSRILIRSKAFVHLQDIIVDVSVYSPTTWHWRDSNPSSDCHGASAFAAPCCANAATVGPHVSVMARNGFYPASSILPTGRHSSVNELYSLH